MTDPSIIDDGSKKGSSKANVAGAFAFFSVLIAVMLSAHFPDTFKSLADSGWPLPLIEAMIAGLLTRFGTWWASEDLFANALAFVKKWNRLRKAVKDGET